MGAVAKVVLGIGATGRGDIRRKRDRAVSRVAPQTRPNEEARAEARRRYLLCGRRHLRERYFNVLSGTKAAGFLGSATASFRTLKTRWSIGEDATKSA